jgi:hypothetical protein
MNLSQLMAAQEVAESLHGLQEAKKIVGPYGRAYALSIRDNQERVFDVSGIELAAWLDSLIADRISKLKELGVEVDPPAPEV